MHNDNEERCEEYPGGIHVVAYDVFPNVPRIIVCFFHGRDHGGARCRFDLFDGVLEQGAHGMGCRTEYEEHGGNCEQDCHCPGGGRSCRVEEEVKNWVIDEWVQDAEEVTKAKPREVDLRVFFWDDHGKKDEEEEESGRQTR